MRNTKLAVKPETQDDSEQDKAAVTPLFSAASVAESRRVRAWLKARIEAAQKASSILVEDVAVTPVMAEIILADHNRGNRPFKSKRFQYAEAMKAGDWLYHSQGISFSREGWLNNGQNRLDAVILSGVESVRMSVAFGEDRAAFSAIDTGAARGGSDSLHIAGYKNTTALAASARLLHTVLAGQPRSNASITNAQVLAVVGEHPRLVDATTPGSRVGQRIRGASVAAPTVAFYLIETHSRSARRLPSFIDLLVHGNIPGKRDPILVLRDAIKDRTLDVPIKNYPAYTCASIIKAWNLWVRGKSCSVSGLNWKSTEPFPMPE